MYLSIHCPNYSNIIPNGAIVLNTYITVAIVYSLVFMFVFFQDGKLSQEEAYVIAQKIGLIAAPRVERTSSLSKSTQLFNFSVYKWSKGRTVQRLILQV